MELRCQSSNVGGYITGMSIDSSQGLVCVNGAGGLGGVRLLHADSLQPFGQIGNVGAVGCATISGGNVYLSGSDGTLQIFDARTVAAAAAAAPSTANVPTRRLRALPPAAGRRLLTVCAVAPSSHLLAAGSAQGGDGDAFVALWDSRNFATPVRLIEDAHTDDITSLVWHPSAPHLLLSASMDGLVCVIDTNQEDQDEVLTSVLNVESSVAAAGWFGRTSEYIYVKTHDEKLALYNAESATSIGLHRDLRNGDMDAGAAPDVGTAETIYGDIVCDVEQRLLEYCIDCHFDEQAGTLTAVCGSHDGKVTLVNVDTDRLSVEATLGDGSKALGHTSTVRSVAWLGKDMYTGGEDGVICAWTPAKSRAASVSSQHRHDPQTKIKSSRSARSSHSPY